jgi:hypothetical protein
MSKDKPKESNLLQPSTQLTEEKPFSLPEKISEEDRLALSDLKSKREIALLNAKLALSQSEVLEVQNSNMILQLAIKFKLNDGDRVGEDGVITRIKQGEDK